MIGKYTIIVIILGGIICAFIILQIINHFTCTQTCHECGSSDGCGGICSGTCPSGSTCINKKCIPQPQPQPCTPTCTTCGVSDGCGGICPCPTGSTCINKKCISSCIPQCGICGSSDGCGGTCSGTCPSGGTCINKKCISCTPTCTTCGVSDGCGGICPCPTGNTCVANTCVNSLLYKFRPIIYLNTAEKFFPTSIEEMLQVSSLTLEKRTIMAQGNVSMDNIASLNAFDPTSSPPGHNLRLNVSKDSHGGHNKDTLHEVPVYVYSYETDTSIIAQYIFIYNYNGAQKILGKNYGQHPGDIEHISVYIDKTTEKITQIYFAEHGTGDGRMVQASDLIFEEDRPRIYSARWSHASYPKVGRWPVKVALNMYDDVTDGTGKRWNPNTIVPIDEKTPWNQFKGNFGGDGGPRSPLSQGWWGNGN